MYAKIDETPLQNEVCRTESAIRQIERNFSEKHSSCYKIILIWMKVNYFKVFFEDFLTKYLKSSK